MLYKVEVKFDNNFIIDIPSDMINNGTYPFIASKLKKNIDEMLSEPNVHFTFTKEELTNTKLLQ